ncbi:MAG: hypothetical protein KME46_33875 [Brasilonema angustatum HA4187-MV1]|jgi:hypothetical protein|nr:hypothetical protein [Brasilonema angustatum HA4187-MV1]
MNKTTKAPSLKMQGASTEKYKTFSVLYFTKKTQVVFRQSSKYLQRQLSNTLAQVEAVGGAK